MTRLAFDNAPEHCLETLIDVCLEDLRERAMASNVVQDDVLQLTPPEYAQWTGERYQLALKRNGRNVWLELIEFRTVPGTDAVQRIPVKQVCDRPDMYDLVVEFAAKA